MTRKRILLPVAAALVGLVVLATVFNWEFWHTAESFDVAAGRMRLQNSVLGICTRDEITETDLSRAYRRLFGELPTPQWRFMHARSYEGLGGAFECGDGTALTTSRELEFAFGLAKFSDDAQRAILKRHFSLIAVRYDPSDSAHKFATQIMELAMRHDGEEIGLSQLPVETTQPDSPPATEGTAHPARGAGDGV